MKRGQLWWEVPVSTVAPFLAVRRPVVVSSSDCWNESKPPLIAVVPIVTKPNPAPTNIELPSGMGGLPQDTALLADHLCFVERQRLVAPMGGELSGEIMAKLQDVLDHTL